MWCPSCGDEFRLGYTRCDQCDVALVRRRPATSSLLRRPAWAHDAVEVDLSDWPEGRRQILSAWVFADNIPAVWADDGSRLLVPPNRAEDVDDLIAMIDANSDDIAETDPDPA